MTLCDVCHRLSEHRSRSLDVMLQSLVCAAIFRTLLVSTVLDISVCLLEVLANIRVNAIRKRLTQVFKGKSSNLYIWQKPLINTNASHSIFYYK